jgi:hypothetical protein
LHRIVGLSFVLVFLGTGAYMRATFPAAWRGDAGMRMMFRSAHVYILLAALLNILAGLSASAGASRPRVRLAGSILMLLPPALFTLAFFTDPAPDRFGRPVVLVGVVAAAAGTLLLSLSAGKSGQATKPEPEG